MSDLDWIACCRLVVHDFLARLILHDPFIKLWSTEQHVLQKIFQNLGCEDAKWRTENRSLLVLVVCANTPKNHRTLFIPFRFSVLIVLLNGRNWIAHHFYLQTTGKLWRLACFGNWLTNLKSVSLSDFFERKFFTFRSFWRELHEKCTISCTFFVQKFAVVCE